MIRSVKDCAPPTPIALWRARVLAFLGAALVGLVVPTGCVVVPEGGYPTHESMQEFFLGSGRTCGCGRCANCEASCGLPAADCVTEVAAAAAPCDTAPYEAPALETAACATAECEPRPKFWHRLHFHRLHLSDPEAGIFNFCVPPQCLNPLPPLPPGRFFPVPVQPVFTQRGDAGYGLVGGFGGADSAGDGSGNCGPALNAPCR
jgi:hypothetical protein